MSVEEIPLDADRKKHRYEFARHAPEYRHRFETITQEMQASCPVAWSETYGGHWVAAGASEVFDLARSAEYLSNDHDIEGVRRGYKGISIPSQDHDMQIQGGFLEMDPPGQREYRQVLNPYLSPAAVARWTPVVDELVRACLDEKIETGQIDFVDHLDPTLRARALPYLARRPPLRAVAPSPLYRRRPGVRSGPGGPRRRRPGPGCATGGAS